MDLKHEILDTIYREESISNPDYTQEELEKVKKQMADAYSSFPGHKVEKIPPGTSGITGPVNFALKTPQHKKKKEK